MQSLAYLWDKAGNLQNRQDLRQSLTESFTYDALDRLTNASGPGVQSLAVGYDAIGNVTSRSDVGSFGYDATGNITSKSDVGTYLYPTSGVGSVRPHAVSSAGGQSYAYDGNGNMTGGAGKTMTWFSYNLPNLITKGTSSSQFFYGAGRGRYKQIAIAGAGGSLPAGTETTLYVGGLFEKVTKPSGVVEYKHYITAGGDPVAMRTLRTNGINDTRYLHKDHLGSVDTITDEFGAVVLRLSFDAFGKRRGSAWSGSPSANDWTSIAATTHRGFTYHEQLDTVDLVHMGGRVYDPTLGRFISADPTVQAPFMSQSLNRYSYVMNNPLSMIDPSGFNWLSSAWKSIKHFVSKYWKVIAAIVVSVVTFGTLAPLASAWLATACLVEGTITVGGAAIAGAVAGALAGGIMGGWKGALVGAVSGALFGASNVAWGQVGNGFGRAAGQAVSSGTIGGVSSEALGGSFRVGFWTGFAASAAYNLYKAVADNYDPTWEKGDDVVSKDPKQEGYSPATPKSNNIGVAREDVTQALDPIWKVIPKFEGNWLFRALNQIPGFNSFATFHDWLLSYFQNSTLGSIVNIPSMAPALALNYAALMNGPQSVAVLAAESDH